MRVKEALEALPEVLSATVSAERDRCDIELRESPRDPKQMVHAVKLLGFDASYLL